METEDLCFLFHSSLVILVIRALISSFGINTILFAFTLNSMNLRITYLFQMYSFAKITAMLGGHYIDKLMRIGNVLLIKKKKKTATAVEFKSKLFSIQEIIPPKIITVLK